MPCTQVSKHAGRSVHVEMSSSLFTHGADIPAMRQMYVNYYSNNSFDVMCMPTTPSTAPPIYSVEPYMLFNGKYLPNRVSSLRRLICSGKPFFGCIGVQGTVVKGRKMHESAFAWLTP